MKKKTGSTSRAGRSTESGQSNKLIVHYVFERNGEWIIAYEIKGEWVPKTSTLIEMMFTDPSVFVLIRNDKVFKNSRGI